MKNILGLDLGTNSIGWALVERNTEVGEGRIIAANSRIIPMDQGKIGDFEKGNSVSQTADRTRYRGMRRLRERYLLRRERLHRVLHILGFLPSHYASEIDFEVRSGQFKKDTEPKINYKKNEKGEYEFLFKPSFEEMMEEFMAVNSMYVPSIKKVPYDWTLYYLRKKALKQKIEKEELAWILLNFNQKRGYYQLSGEEESESEGKVEEFYSLKVTEIKDTGEKKGEYTLYTVVLENGWEFRKQSRIPLLWKDQIKDFIVTTMVDGNGEVRKDKYGNDKRTFRIPSEEDWTLKKKKAERNLEESSKTVGCYIYDALLKDPNEKVKGGLIQTIDRRYYKDELIRILDKQKEFHPELNDRSIYQNCVESLYSFNENHKYSIKDNDFTYLLVEDILFYQRPLKSQKSLISSCSLERRYYKDKDGNVLIQPLRCIPKSNPLFQEFRLWQFLHNLRIYKREAVVNGKRCLDVEVTSDFLSKEQDWEELFDWLSKKKEIKQDILLKYPKFNLKKSVGEYRWNYVEDKVYPCSETHVLINTRLQRLGLGEIALEEEYRLWHVLYSISDPIQLKKALNKFASQKDWPESFADAFMKFPSFNQEYGAYSEKAIKRLLPLMRMGRYWKEQNIDDKTKDRINKLIDGECDEAIRQRVREKAIHLTTFSDFKGLPLWLASYVIYDRHSEASDILRWKTPADIDFYLTNVFKQHSLRNPIVEQIMVETLRVVKDIWVNYGNSKPGFFDEIHIELGRDIKSTAEKRKQMSARNTVNENTNLRIRALLTEFKEMGDIENVRPYSPMQQELLKIYEQDILSSKIEIPEDIKKITRSAQPSKSEIMRYRLWMEQKYTSPYTGQVIPLSRLFTHEYEIEHIIPQSRYFDNSMTNKVICESAVNKDKGASLGYEYIKNNQGKIVQLGLNRNCKILSIEAYEEFITSRYSSNKQKLKNLLLEDIPDSFIERQLNDTRYVSRTLRTLLSAIVRTDEEQESVSKNVISNNGSITTELKKHWGLIDVWNEIITSRFERLNQITNEHFGEWTNKNGKRVFQIDIPDSIAKGFNRKRIDHRHHALDAIVIACTTREHINYINNEEAKSKQRRNDLRYLLCEKHSCDDKGNYKWVFKKPWSSFTVETKNILLSAIVSFKQNLGVINKTVNYYEKWLKDENGIYKKGRVKQIKGDNWAIRKPLHKETFYGKISLQMKKEVAFSTALDNWESIVDRRLRGYIRKLISQYGRYDKKTILKYFKDRDYKFKDQNISRLEIYAMQEEMAVARTSLNESFTLKKIESIPDKVTQDILRNHLLSFAEIKDSKTIEHPELAFSAEGIELLNKSIISLNSGKPHAPIYKVRVCEPIGNKFQVGISNGKDKKYVEAAKGTNLFFAIYQDEEGKRSYETIPLNIIIERQKQGLPSVPEFNKDNIPLLFFLSPNDLVYVPTQDELESGRIDWEDRQRVSQRIYKTISFTGTQCFFIPVSVATPIISPQELGANNKSERSWEGQMIKEIGIPIKVDRLGNIKQR